MSIKKYNMFIESNLNLSELDKETSGKKRGDVLIDKLKNNTDFEKSSGGKVKIDSVNIDGVEVDAKDVADQLSTNNQYDSDKGKRILSKNGKYPKIISTDKDDKLQLNQLKKTTEFGSSGSGRLTKEYESIQCLFLAIKLKNRNINLTLEYVLSEFNKYKDNETFLKDKFNVYLISNNIITNEIIEELSSNEDWLSTFIDIPNKLCSFESKSIKELDKKLIRSDIDYSTYHLSYKDKTSPISILTNKYRSLITDNINFSKYCPADVFLIDNTKINRIIYDITSSNTIDELTNKLDRLFDERLFLPISLKKVKKGDNTFRIIINKERGKRPPTFDIKNLLISINPLKGIGSKIGVGSNWLDTKGNNIDKQDRTINFDSSNTGSSLNVDGEVDGSMSRQGKISFTSIDRILNFYRNRNLKFQQLDKYHQLRDKKVEELEILISEISDKIKLGDSNGVIVNPILKGYTLNTENKLISKLQSLQIILAFKELNNINRVYANQAITKIMRFALSIQTDKFKSPRYIRII